jgi:hypothetical protein
MNKNIITIIACVLAFLLMAVVPFLVTVPYGTNVTGDIRVKYLKGLTQILDFAGADSMSYDIYIVAHKIEYDLHPVEVEFNNDLESRLILAEAEIIEPDVRVWGNDSEYYSTGYGLHRFYIPRTKVTDFESSMRRFKAEHKNRLLTGGHGFILESVNMNKLLEWLAKTAQLEYYHNPALDESIYEVSGRIPDIDDPLSKVGIFARAYRLNTKVVDDVLYAWPTHHAELQPESN